MNLSETAQTLISKLTDPKVLHTHIRALAKEIGKNPELSDELWETGVYNARMLALLIADVKQFTPGKLDGWVQDITESGEVQEDVEWMCDWLLANIIMKNPKLPEQVTGWENDPSLVKQRIYWAYRCRTAKSAGKEVNLQLLETIENAIDTSHPMVQWMMNMCAGFIGMEDAELRTRCIELGERTGLYADYPVSKGCTSPYLPDWLNSISEKKK
jgi:3-methyladenine DNA glycosylase AlkD